MTSLMKKPPGRKKKFQEKWQERKEFSDWLRPFSRDDSKAYCCLCGESMNATLCEIQSHERNNRQIHNVKLKSSTSNGNNTLNIDDDNQTHVLELDYLESELAESDEDEDSSLTRFHWNSKGVRLLIQYISSYWKDLSDGLRKKKDIWQDISVKMNENGFPYDSIECAKKFRNIKMRYYSVLRKQTLGDKSSLRIDYFDQLHKLLCCEPETVAKVRQIKLESQPYTMVGTESEDENIVFGSTEYDIVNDGSMEWTISSSNLLLDLLLEFKDWSLNELENEDTIWEIIAEQMNKEGYPVDKTKCKRKWQNLYALHEHYNIADSTGNLSMWPYYARVRRVIKNVELPFTSDEEKFSVYMNNKKRKIAKEKSPPEEKDSIADNDDNTSLSNEIKKYKRQHLETMQYIHKLQSDANIWERINNVEAKLDDLSDQQEIQKQTNSLLTQILNELSTLASHVAPARSAEIKDGITIVVPQDS